MNPSASSCAHEGFRRTIRWSLRYTRTPPQFGSPSHQRAPKFAQPQSTELTCAMGGHQREVRPHASARTRDTPSRSPVTDGLSHVAFGIRSTSRIRRVRVTVTYERADNFLMVIPPSDSDATVTFTP